MLTEDLLAAPALPSIAPVWRQGRLEEKVAQAIAAGASRSTIREAVDQLVLHLRAQEIPAAHGLSIVMDVASRAVSTRSDHVHAFETSVDCLALVAKWAGLRYARAD